MFKYVKNNRILIVTFTGPLPDSGKDGVTTVGLGHVVDQLHDEHGLAHSGTTKQTLTCSVGFVEHDARKNKLFMIIKLTNERRQRCKAGAALKTFFFCYGELLDIL